MPNLCPHDRHADPDTNFRTHPYADSADGNCHQDAASDGNLYANPHRDLDCDANFHADRDADADAQRDAHRLWTGVIPRRLFAEIHG